MITSSSRYTKGSDRVAQKMSEFTEKEQGGRLYDGRLNDGRVKEGSIDFFTIAIVLGGLLILSLLAVLFYLMAEPHTAQAGMREYYSSSAPPAIPGWAAR